MISPQMIQAFLSIVEYGNITAAANSMYTTQSSLSKLIAQLEQETGADLLIRRKGHSAVSLTPQGKRFLEIANHWQSVMHDFQEVRNTESITEVSIGALDRINCFALSGFYRNILKTRPDIRIDTHTRHSKEIYRMMENRQLDLGFVSALMPVNNLIIRPLYYEVMFVVSSADSGLSKIISPEDLDPAKEVYSRWSDEFEIWHDQIWPGRKYRIHVGTTSMIPDYLDEPGRWSILPVSTLHAMLANRHFTHHTLTADPPQRAIYLLEQKNPRQSREKEVNEIKDALISYFENDPFLKMIG